MGLPANVPFDVGGLPAELPLDRARPAVDDLIAAGRLSRPDFAAQRALAQKAAAHVGVVRAEGLPSLSLQGSAGRNYYGGGAPDSRQDNWAAGVQLNVPLFRGFSNTNDLRRAREDEAGRRRREELAIRSASLDQDVFELSGGNQQKTVLAKWLSSRINLLVLDHPTRGVDVGAKAEIYRLMRKLASEGIGMLIMCDTLEEDIGLCNRMLVMKDGRLVKELECLPNRRPSPQDIIGLIV
jgi:hypothetical protein